MNTNVAAAGEQIQQQVTDISSMLLVVDGRLLLLPGVAVAEIVSFVPPEPDDDETMPTWYLGNIYWRNQRVPLVAFETMIDGRPPMASSHCRIAVINNTGVCDQLKFFALLLRTTPKLLRLAPDAITVNHEKILEDGEKLHVVVAGEEAVIPDIQRLERQIADLLQLA